MSRSPVVLIDEPGRSRLHIVLHGPLEVGRDCAGVLLDDPGTSRRHLLMRPENGRVVVEDLGSTNGTTVDGRPLEGTTTLGANSVVRLGDTTIRLTDDVQAGLPVIEQTRPVTSIEHVAARAAAERPAAPAAATRNGTVTIVFTDIESSTERSQSFGDRRWYEILTAHNQVVRRQLSEHGGVEIKSQGDGFMLAFESAGSAVQFMIATQRDIAAMRAERPEEAVRIRMGAHTGEAIADDDGDLFGLHVNIAARVAGLAEGDEIIVSSLVREIVQTRGDLRFGSPRHTQLKGLTGTYVLHPVLWQNEHR